MRVRVRVRSKGYQVEGRALLGEEPAHTVRVRVGVRVRARARARVIGLE